MIHTIESNTSCLQFTRTLLFSVLLADGLFVVLLCSTRKTNSAVTLPNFNNLLIHEIPSTQQRIIFCLFIFTSHRPSSSPSSSSSSISLCNFFFFPFSLLVFYARCLALNRQIHLFERCVSTPLSGAAAEHENCLRHTQTNCQN